MYGFASPGFRFCTAGSFSFEPSKSVWFDMMMSAPVRCTTSRNFLADELVVFEPIRVGRRGRDIGVAAANPVEQRAAPERYEMRFAVVFHGNQRRNGACRVPRRQVH